MAADIKLAFCREYAGVHTAGKSEENHTSFCVIFAGISGCVGVFFPHARVLVFATAGIDG